MPRRRKNRSTWRPSRESRRSGQRGAWGGKVTPSCPWEGLVYRPAEFCEESLCAWIRQPAAVATAWTAAYGKYLQTRQSLRAAAAAAPAQLASHPSVRQDQNKVQYEAIALSFGFLGRAGKMPTL